ncbi:RlpA-like double-psi beta-barrel-protein domain-containing protein-containing protein [Radiomyces spectabilis]|uniref:RlpA-like double-psi beta-barrel-protein domain-containing protein-containing protein n=1 Tax=Radiomyces spectabilis TaxID=64574 RepID=UPI00221F5956|nr:RlpA-like double-psi beta-barrel-protein domain-containing protein-containing protein [Radiomyces spectabilis]KAI8379645.1 RlpA-like double-psi beta-barrel-protein domain-containing protein-containing protein [Radiomyces spectabilis]
MAHTDTENGPPLNDTPAPQPSRASTFIDASIADMRTSNPRLSSFLPPAKHDSPLRYYPPPTIWTRFAEQYRYGRWILLGLGMLGVFTVMFIVLGTLGILKNRTYRAKLGFGSVGKTKYEGDSWGSATPNFDMGGKGDGTYYDPGVGLTACGGLFTAQEMVVALNKIDYGQYVNPNDSPVCGQCIIVTGPLGSAKATIQDQCPGCGRGSLDLSPAVFGEVGDFTEGRIPVSWKAC